MFNFDGLQPSGQLLPQPVQEDVQAKRKDVARTSKKAKKNHIPLGLQVPCSHEISLTGPLESGCPKSGSPVVAATHSELPPPENPATVPLTAAGDGGHATPSLENASTPVLAVASPPTLAEAVPSAVPAAVLPLARWSRTATEEEKETSF